MQKSECFNAKITELESPTNNLDQTSFWKCLKSTNATVKQKDAPLISEQTWLNGLQSLHSNTHVNSTQEIIDDKLKHLEIRKNHSCPSDYTISEDELRAAVNILKNKKSPLSDKISQTQTPLLYVFLNLKVHNVQKNSYHFDCIDQQKRCINLFRNNLPTENRGLCTFRVLPT